MMLLPHLAFSLLLLNSQDSDISEHALSLPPDALSVTLPAPTSYAQVRYQIDGSWSAWESFHVDNEQDPYLRESNLIVFPPTVENVQVRTTSDVTLHPIENIGGPVHYHVAATRTTGTPRILSREEWGADESLLYRTSSSASSTPRPEENGGSSSSTPSQRVRDCEEAQLNYPKEFKVKRTETENAEGKQYRWPHEYSSSIKLIAVHHTAIKVDGDVRSGAERVRALYQYHANNRGWGDVGYHYLIDEKGQIYEGKSGGDYVVGGHAYCNNIGTVGVALLGNFEEERPTQKQLASLQWLIGDLADRYSINLERRVTFHGKKLDPVVGHRDLVSTDCPGYYVYGALDQILTHAAAGTYTASVTLPPSPQRSSARTVVQRTGRSTSSTRNTRATGQIDRLTQRGLNTRAALLLRRKLRLQAAANKGSAGSTRVQVRRSASRSSAHSSLRSRKNTTNIRIRLTRKENGATSCDAYDLPTLRTQYRGTITCSIIDGTAALINTVSIEEYMAGLAEEPDTEPYEKQRAFAIAARTYAAYYTNPTHPRKFPNMPYDGSDSPATFQLYGGKEFEARNPRWVEAVRSTAHVVLRKDGSIIRAPYFSASDGRTRSPSEAGWNNFPFADIFASKDDPWCAGEIQRGHGVGMSGCGAEGQANEGKTAEEILAYYYPGTDIEPLDQ